MSKQLAKCPFCGVGNMYEIQREDELGTVIPQLFCNCCKMIFEVENDSPYLSDEKTLEYLKEKLLKTFNTRKPMEAILEQLENAFPINPYPNEFSNGRDFGIKKAIEIVREEGGMND